MKKVENKTTAILLFALPYIVGLALIVSFALVYSLALSETEYGYVLKQTFLESILTYLPLAIGSLIVAYLLKRAIRKNFDLEIIGVEKVKKPISFFPIAIVVICFAVSMIFGMQRAYVKDNVISEKTAFKVNRTVYSSSTDWEYDFDSKEYTIILASGKKFVASKNSKGGQEIEKVLFLD